MVQRILLFWGRFVWIASSRGPGVVASAACRRRQSPYARSTATTTPSTLAIATTRRETNRVDAPCTRSTTNPAAAAARKLTK
jgi:hypothetical protein